MDGEAKKEKEEMIELENKSKEELLVLLNRALELIWYMEHGFSKQKEAIEFMKECSYNFYYKA